MAEAHVSIIYFYYNIAKQPTTKCSDLKTVNKLTLFSSKVQQVDRVVLLAWARFGRFQLGSLKQSASQDLKQTPKMASALINWLCSVWLLILQETSLNMFSWQRQGSKRRNKNIKVFCKPHWSKRNTWPTSEAEREEPTKLQDEKARGQEQGGQALNGSSM